MIPRDCFTAVLKATALLDGDLSPDGLAGLKAHLAACTGCRDALAGALGEALRASMLAWLPPGSA